MIAVAAAIESEVFSPSIKVPQARFPAAADRMQSARKRGGCRGKRLRGGLGGLGVVHGDVLFLSDVP